MDEKPEDRYVAHSLELKTPQSLGFALVRERAHIGTIRENADGTRTPLTMPNYPPTLGASSGYHAP